MLQVLHCFIQAYAVAGSLSCSILKSDDSCCYGCWSAAVVGVALDAVVAIAADGISALLLLVRICACFM